MGSVEFPVWVTRVRMKRSHRKAITALLMGGYFLAVTVGGAFHTHLGRDCCTERGEPADACHEHVCHAEYLQHRSACCSEQSDSPVVLAVAAPFDTHCAICSFLSQKPIPVAAYANEASAELEQRLVRVWAIPPSDDIPTTVFSRGPPIA
jgi:hypothetical protein